MKGYEQVGKQQQEENRQEGQERTIRGIADWYKKINWLRKIPWITGTIIYGWIIFATLTGYSYQEFNWEKSPDFVSWIIFIGVLIVLTVLILIFSLNKENVEIKKNNFLEKTLWGILPTFYLLIAVTILTLVLMTYQFEWRAARQGIATIFASMFAAVGVMVSVAVSYKTGEENRLAQQKNLETQLEHQRTLEQEKGIREQQKLDAELIKNLNDRLHEIIPRRYGSDKEASASYFQLAALYKDWETLATTSDLIGGQKESQQRNILKLLFGVYQEQTQTKEAGDGDNSAFQESSGAREPGSENKPASRSEVDIRTLNSVIQDIFPECQKKKEEPSAARDEELKDKEPESVQYSYDLSYLDLRDLDLNQKDLSHANLKGAHLRSTDLRRACLEGANLQRAHLGRAFLWDAHLGRANLILAHLGRADLMGAHLGRADLMGAHLERANLRRAHLERANLRRAHLERANLSGARLEGTNLWGVYLESASFFGITEDPRGVNARKRIVNQLKKAKILPSHDELLKAKDFDQALVDDIMKAHEEHHKDNQQ